MENDKPYSFLAEEIKNKIYEGNIDITEAAELIRDSHELAQVRGTDTSRELHNKLLELLLLKYPDPETEALAETYYLHPEKLQYLVDEFHTDPSNMEVVFMLAIEYYKIGWKQRAKQLFNRVARSGYKEKGMAIAFSNEHHEGLN